MGQSLTLEKFIRSELGNCRFKNDENLCQATFIEFNTCQTGAFRKFVKENVALLRLIQRKRGYWLMFKRILNLLPFSWRKNRENIARRDKRDRRSQPRPIDEKYRYPRVVKVAREKLRKHFADGRNDFDGNSWKQAKPKITRKLAMPLEKRNGDSEIDACIGYHFAKSRGTVHAP